MHESNHHCLLLTGFLIGFLVLFAFLVGPGTAAAYTYDTTFFFPDYSVEPDADWSQTYITGVGATNAYQITSTRDHILLVHQLEPGDSTYWYINSALQPGKSITDEDYVNYWGTSVIPTVTSPTGFAKSGIANYLKKIPLDIAFKVVRNDVPVAYTMSDVVYACVMNGHPCLVVYNEVAYRQNSAGADYQWFGGTSWRNVKGQKADRAVDTSYCGGKLTDWQVFDAQYYTSSTPARTWQYKTTVSYDEWYLFSTGGTSGNPVMLTTPGGYYGYDVTITESDDGELLSFNIRPDGSGGTADNGYYREEEGNFGFGTWYQQEGGAEPIPYNPYYPPTEGPLSSYGATGTYREFIDGAPCNYYYDGEIYRKYKYRAVLEDDNSDRFRYVFSLEYVSSCGHYLVAWNSDTSTNTWYYVGEPYTLSDYIEEEEPEEPVVPEIPEVEQKDPIVDGTGLPNLGFYPTVDFTLSADLTGAFAGYLYNPYLGISEAYHSVKDGIDGYMADIMELPFYALKVHVWKFDIMIQDNTRYVVGLKEDYAVPFYNFGVSISRFVPSTVWYVCSVVLIIFCVVAVVEVFTGTFSDFIRRRMI